MKLKCVGPVSLNELFSALMQLDTPRNYEQVNEHVDRRSHQLYCLPRLILQAQAA